MNLNFIWNIKIVHLRFKFKWGSDIFVCWIWWSLPRVTLKLHLEMIPAAGSSRPLTLGVGCRPPELYQLWLWGLTWNLFLMAASLYHLSPVRSWSPVANIPKERCLSVSLVIWEIQVKMDLGRWYSGKSLGPVARLHGLHLSLPVSLALCLSFFLVKYE